jgi:protein SCO1/2
MPGRAIAAWSVIIGLAFTAGWWLGAERQPDQGDWHPRVAMQDSVVTVLAEPKPLSEFHLASSDGGDYGPDQLRGVWTLMFFGYTSCPDVCPGTLAVLARVHDQLINNGMPARRLRVVFVSVDPQRDSLEQLFAYVRFFHQRFVGVTGKRKQIDRLISQFGARYRIGDKTGRYAVEHTDAVFLINPAGRYQAFLSSPHQVDRMVSRIQLVRELFGSASATSGEVKVPGG